MPSTRGRDDFRQFCATNTFFAPFTEGEERGIRLLDVLRLKKAPINAYSALCEWHLREAGQLADSDGLAKVPVEQYIGRKPLIKRLEKRYNLQGKGPQEKVVRLPFSREVVRIPVFDAEDCLVQLLTNPLLTANDFDFFDDDPRAGPPQDSLFVGNNNKPINPYFYDS